MAAWLGARLVKHTLVALVIFGSTVLAPALLLLRKKCGQVCVIAALTLLAVGSASLLGAAVCRGLDRGSLSPKKWRLLVASVWIFNPVLLTIGGLEMDRYEITWWSGMPLAVVLALLSGRTRLAASDPDWVQEGCPLSPALMLHWLFFPLDLHRCAHAIGFAAGGPMLALQLDVSPDSHDWPFSLWRLCSDQLEVLCDVPLLGQPKVGTGHGASPFVGLRLDQLPSFNGLSDR